MKTKKAIVVSMTAAVAALGSHANDAAARAALADMANEYPNHIISMVPEYTWNPFDGFCA